MAVTGKKLPDGRCKLPALTVGASRKVVASHAWDLRCLVVLVALLAATTAVSCGDVRSPNAEAALQDARRAMDSGASYRFAGYWDTSSVLDGEQSRTVTGVFEAPGQHYTKLEFAFDNTTGSHETLFLDGAVYQRSVPPPAGHEGWRRTSLPVERFSVAGYIPEDLTDLAITSALRHGKEMRIVTGTQRPPVHSEAVPLYTSLPVHRWAFTIDPATSLLVESTLDADIGTYSIGGPGSGVDSGWVRMAFRFFDYGRAPRLEAPDLSE